MRSVLLLTLACIALIGSVATPEVSYEPEFTGTDLPEGALDEIGNWGIEDGVLRQTDLQTHPSLIFFPGTIVGDFEMSVDFNIRNTPTAVRAADLIFRAQDTSSFYYFHIDTRNEMVAFARAQDGNYWTDVVRAMGNPITLDEWHEARIVGEGDAFTIWIDGTERQTVQHDALGAGCVGLGTASADVQFKNLRVTGTEAKLDKEFGRGASQRIRVARHSGPGLPDFAPSLCRTDDGLLMAYSTGAVKGDEEAEEPLPGDIMLTESHDEGLAWSEPRVVEDSEGDARDPVLSALLDGSVLLACRTSEIGDLALMVSDDGRAFRPLTTIALPGATLMCRQPAFLAEDGGIVWPLMALQEEQQGIVIARSADGGLRNWEFGPVRWRRREGAGTVAQTVGGDLLLVTEPDLKLSRSDDMGETWRSTGRTFGIGEDPTFFRTADGTLLLAYRRDPFGVHVMRCLDEEKGIWQGPIIAATNPGRGAISLADLDDGRVICAYGSDSPAALVVGVVELDHPQIMPGLFGAMAEWPQPRAGIVAPAWARNNRNTEGAIVRLEDGSFLLAYSRFYGGGADHSPADVSALRSFDDGESWEGPFLMQPNDGGCMVGSVSFLRLQSGTILWGYARKDTVTNLCRFFVRRSSDEGKTWTREVCATPQMAYHVVNNDRVKQLSSGRLLVPTAMIPDWREGFEQMGLQVFYSDDEGETWQTSGQVLHLKGSAQEPATIELRDGRVMMICRTTLGHIYECYSADGGVTFSELESMGVVAPCSPCSIRRIPTTGDLLLIFSDNTGARVPHASMISSDEGETWQNLRHIEPKGSSFAYTSVCFWDDMTMLSYWDAGPGGLSLRVKKLPISWYYGPEVSADESVNVRARSAS